MSRQEWCVKCRLAQVIRWSPAVWYADREQAMIAGMRLARMLRKEFGGSGEVAVGGPAGQIEMLTISTEREMGR
jgi:hypothetical protein